MKLTDKIIYGVLLISLLFSIVLLFIGVKKGRRIGVNNNDSVFPGGSYYKYHLYYDPMGPSFE